MFSEEPVPGKGDEVIDRVAEKGGNDYKYIKELPEASHIPEDVKYCS